MAQPSTVGLGISAVLLPRGCRKGAAGQAMRRTMSTSRQSSPGRCGFRCATHFTNPPSHRLSRLWQNRRNSTLTEVLIFHQILSTPKASYSRRYPSVTPQGRTRKIHIFPKDPIMRTSYNTCPFHTSEFLKSTLLQYQISECGMINNGI